MRVNIAMPGRDYVTNWTEFVRIQNGRTPSQTEQFAPGLRYILNIRDMSRWVHMDVLFQAYFEAMLFLFQMNAPLKADLPYSTMSPYFATQDGFATYGQPFFASNLASAAAAALQHAWFEKWFVHLRLRPEAYGGRVSDLSCLCSFFFGTQFNC
jgi:hypothetical protein